MGGETEKQEIGAARKTSGGAAQLGMLGGGEASSWRPIYRRWKAVEKRVLVAGRRASRRPLMAPGVVERRHERRGGSGTTGRVGQGRSEHLGRVERVGTQGCACGVWEARLRHCGARRRSRRPARLWPGEQLGGSALALRGWRGAACCIAHEARERISAFAWLASRVLWLCCCCVHAVDGLCVCSLHVQAQERGGGEESKWLMEKKKKLT